MELKACKKYYGIIVLLDTYHVIFVHSTIVTPFLWISYYDIIMFLVALYFTHTHTHTYIVLPQESTEWNKVELRLGLWVDSRLIPSFFIDNALTV